MILAHRVSLNGSQLDEIDDRIIIKGIEVSAGKETVTAAGTGSGDGSRVTGKRRESVEVAVRFSMNIRRNLLPERAALLEAINAWAAPGGFLRINYKPGRRLRADEVTTPGEGDLWKRFDEYTITFKAHAVPFWEEDSAVSASTKSGTTGSGALAVAGSAKTLLDAELVNKSGATINTASVTVGGKTMSFENLGLANGQTLLIDHPLKNGKVVLRIRIGSSSVMAKRTAESADDFEVSPGACSFSFTAQRACLLTVTGRGRFV